MALVSLTVTTPATPGGGGIPAVAGLKSANVTVPATTGLVISTGKDGLNGNNGATGAAGATGAMGPPGANFRGAYAGGTTYAAGDWVTASDGLPYASIAGGNVGHDPTTDAGVHWQSWFPAIAHMGSTSIDLNRGPYNAVVGADITTALQSAITTLAANGFGGDIYFSQPGTYLLNGAQQSGTAFSIAYTGQILFPGFPESGPTIAIKIRGCGQGNTIGGQTGSPSSVTLASNAGGTAGGQIFSVIPGQAGGVGFSNVCPMFEDITIKAQGTTDPQCGGLNMVSAAKFACDRLNISGGGNPVSGSFTGTLVGLVLPGLSNEGFQTVKDTVVQGWPVGFKVSEHVAFVGYVSAGLCGTAFRGGGGSVLNQLQNFHVRGCPTIFDSLSAAQSAVIEGNVHIEPGGLAASGLLVNDTLGSLSGKITVDEQGFANPGALAGIFPGPESQNLDIQTLHTPQNTVPGRGVGWMACHPVDRFLRKLPEPSSAAIPGRCSDTNHPWYLKTGTFTNTQGASNGTIVSTVGAGFSQAFVRTLHGGVSRVISVPLTTWSGAYAFFLYGHYINNGTNNAKTINVAIGGGNLKLNIAGTLTQTVSGILASTTYTIALAITYDSGGLPNRARAYLNGIKVADAYVTAAQQALLTPVSGVSVATVLDGFGMQSDTGSAITGFTVADLSARTDYNEIEAIAAPTYGTTITPDASLGPWQTITVTDGVAFTIAAPTNPPTTTVTEELTIEVLNSSGGAMGAITWNAAFVFAGITWANPATTKKRSVTFRWNGAKWVARSFTTADY